MHCWQHMHCWQQCGTSIWIGHFEFLFSLQIQAFNHTQTLSDILPLLFRINDKEFLAIDFHDSAMPIRNTCTKRCSSWRSIRSIRIRSSWRRSITRRSIRINRYIAGLAKAEWLRANMAGRRRGNRSNTLEHTLASRFWMTGSRGWTKKTNGGRGSMIGYGSRRHTKDGRWNRDGGRWRRMASRIRRDGNGRLRKVGRWFQMCTGWGGHCHLHIWRCGFWMTDAVLLASCRILRLILLLSDISFNDKV